MMVRHTVTLDDLPTGEMEYELNEMSPVGIILKSHRKLVATNDRGTVETWERIDDDGRTKADDYTGDAFSRYE